ncbi:membrane protease subunit, stomatin/prohibitin [Beggiatoa alba B18LD]|uniref:Membrane protease subunit, stomatin/prohibitin n=1 Tax=Beggiatoa alba B18LD TaxID=395493 RepID=I3CL35_9GAMM|nr:slipin family protein [Beggiatoa alba]EIJ44328.1 membrane protease subunit, stomatin/prohibitin [Beggiatoa alba B18LD]
MMTLWRKFVVRKNERGLLFKDGDFQGFLEAGTYKYLDPFKKVTVEVCNLAKPEFDHAMIDFFLTKYAEEMQKYCVKVELNNHQVALIRKNGVITDILYPTARQLYWKGFVTVEAEIIDISENYEIPKEKAAMLVYAKNAPLSSRVSTAIYSPIVPEYHVGVLTVDGQRLKLLNAGLYAYWTFNRRIAVDVIDTRLQETEIAGQEILTKDKVTLRINLSASYQITDFLKLSLALSKPIEFIYKELQFGLRAVVGTRTLDELLENKTVIDEQVFAHIQTKTTDLGIVVHSVGVKDIILPGDMKTILSKVVEAEKVAQANLIRRREETAATRSLLNTAKVMEDNPTALRLKELETLEKVTEKVGNISVYGGLEGLLKELVKIRGVL